jgi:hypothetical protein
MVLKGVQVYEFHSRCWPVRALTSDRSGASLPAVYAPWDAQNGEAVVSELSCDLPLYRLPVRHSFFLTSIKERPFKQEQPQRGASG